MIHVEPETNLKPSDVKRLSQSGMFRKDKVNVVIADQKKAPPTFYQLEKLLSDGSVRIETNFKMG